MNFDFAKNEEKILDFWSNKKVFEKSLAKNKKGKNFVELTPSNELIVTVESFGQISEEEIFKKAIEVLKNDLKEFSKKINK